MRAISLIKISCALFACSVLLLSPARASTYNWTTWSSQTGNTVNGTLTFGTQTVNITYTGETEFTQLNNTGYNYYTPASTYVNGPTTSDMIAIDGTATTHTITFSSPVTNPVMAIVSLGQPGLGTVYNFDAPFTILNQGSGIPYGGCATCLSGSGTDSLTGTEGDGIIEFAGTFSSLSWTGANPEYWNGFTFGAAGVGTPSSGVPEPGSLGLAALALALVALSARRWRSRA